MQIFPRKYLLLAGLINTLAILCASATDGEIDDGFKPLVTGSAPYVFASVVQSDGKILIGGNFSEVNNQQRIGVARLNSDGSLDVSFNPLIGGAVPRVNCIALQPDGKILLGGEFGSINDQPRNRIARINADGTLDNSFNIQGTGKIWTISLQDDGKILLGGEFLSFGGLLRQRIARLMPNGIVDESWAAGVIGQQAMVFALAQQDDGSVLVGGLFALVSGFTRNNIARFDSDGVLDESFSPNATGTQPRVNSITTQKDRKILVAGAFNNICGASRNNIARLHQNGALDDAFDPNIVGGYGLTQVKTVALQADGKILVGGQFGSISGIPCANIARLNEDGSLDQTFNAKVDMFPWSISIQSGGAVIVAGWFTNLANSTFNNIARMTNSMACEMLTLTSSNSIHWLRSGTATEIEGTVFEASLNHGRDWTMLGNGTRTTNGWEITGVSLPPAAYIRAWGRASNGHGNGGLACQTYGFGLFRSLRHENGIFHATFTGVPGFTYTIQSTSALGEPWNTLTNYTLGTSGTLNYLNSAGTPQQYYRFVTPLVELP